MTNKVYKTAQGRVVDIGALMLQHENERAVGNMQVNARGDKIDADGNSIASRTQQSNKQYQQQTNTSSGAVATSVRSQKELEAAAQRAEEERRIMEARADRQAKRNALAQGKNIEIAEAPLTGLAAALAAASTNKDEE
jgi:hypothetical protein